MYNKNLIHNWIWNLKFHSKRLNFTKTLKEIKLTIFKASFTTKLWAFSKQGYLSEGNLTFLSLEFSLKLVMSYQEKWSPFIDFLNGFEDFWNPRIWNLSNPSKVNCLFVQLSLNLKVGFEAHRFSPPNWRAVLLTHQSHTHWFDPWFWRAVWIMDLNGLWTCHFH